MQMVTSLNQLCKGVGRTDSPESWGFPEQATSSLLFKSGSNKVPVTTRLGHGTQVALYYGSILQLFLKASLCQIKGLAYLKKPRISFHKLSEEKAF